jgi:hypothetical protein
MSHKANDPEVLSETELELVESDRHAEEKYKSRIHKDILGLQTESDLVLFKHIPEIVHKLDRVASDIVIIRDDYTDTNRLVRKMYYDMIPSLHTKIDNLGVKFDLICSKLNELLNK